jgi:hypothetical protein
MRRRLIYALVLFLFFVVVTEIGMRVVDPWGAWRYYSDLDALPFRDEPRGVGFSPGVYTFSGWSATILLDGSRYVPETNTRAACTIALVGDSVTFSYGVSDAETWANLVARELPNTRIINMGIPGYNAWNVARTIRHFRADGYFYYFVNNDDQPEPRWDTKWKPASAMEVYLYTWRFAQGFPYTPRPGIAEVIAEIAGNPNVVTVAIDRPSLGRDLAARYPIALIAPYTERISQADAHANVRGNWQIAEAVMPHLRALVSRVCR